MADDPLHEKEIFNRARQIAAPEERRAWLEQACGQDPATRQRVLELLRVYDQERSFLELSPAAVAATIVEPIADHPGGVIGPFKLLEKIGEGGFGVVFMAEQTQPVRRRVALKVLKPGMDTRQVVARFEAERQALAIMDHPNIAKVHDGGATPSGRPYFVMELVKGVPITEFCDQHHLTPRQRLELFVPVCQAVQHAHQKGIIHRDLKPSNVLVTVHDTNPVVKVIDFGVAKALGQELTDKTLFTGFAQMVGTPLYMSPEQAGQSGLDVDTRSDIYSLGVLLYELLTGTTPFTRERFKQAAFDEICRIIREEEPPRPSTRLLDSKDSLPSISAVRGTEPAKLTKLIHGELDWIVMKALEKDRNRRYETANGFARDIERYLTDEPVQACPPSSAYRLRKFVRRHRRPVLAGAVMLILLVGGVIGTTLGLVRAIWAEGEANDQRVRAEKERDAKEGARREAVANAARAEANAQRAAANFQDARAAVDDMYTQVAEKWLANQAHLEPLQREFLQKTLRFYEKFASEKSDDPVFRQATAQAYRRVADIQKRLGQAVPAEEAFREAIDRFESLSAEFPGKPEYRQALADTLHNFGVVLGETGRGSDDLKTHRRALEIEEQLVADFPGLPEYRASLGRGYYFLGTGLRGSSEAEKAFRAALAIAKELVADSPADPQYRSGLARTHQKVGEYKEAEDILETLVREFPGLPEYRSELGYVYAWHAKVLPPQEAEKFYKMALDIQERLAADFPAVSDYQYDVLRSLNDLGAIMASANRNQEAEETYRKGITIGEKLAADAPTVIYYRVRLSGLYHALTDLLMRTGNLQEAEATIQKAIDFNEKSLSDFPDLPDFCRELISSCLRRVQLLDSTGRGEAASALYQRILAADLLSVDSYEYLAWHFIAPGRLQDGVKAYQQVIASRPKEPGGWLGRGEFYARLGLWDLAARDFAQAFHNNPPATPRQCFSHALLSLSVGDIATCERMCALLPRQFSPEKPLADLEHELVRACTLAASPQADLDWAIRMGEKAVERHDDGAWNYTALALAHFRAGHFDRAIKLAQQSLKTDPGWLGGGHNFPILAMAYHRLGRQKEAREALQSTAHLISEWSGSFLRSRSSVPLHWRDWLSCFLLYREARILIEGTPPPEDWRLCMDRARMLKALNDNGGAAAAWEKAIEINPQLTEHFKLNELDVNHYDLGIHLKEKGDLDGAAAEFRRAWMLGIWAGRNELLQLLSRSGKVREVEELRAAWEKELEHNPPEYDAWFGYAELCLSLGMEDAYRRNRTALLDRFAQTTNPVVAGLTSRACLVLPASGTELERAVALAERAVTLEKGPFFMATKALAEYRLGQFESAIDWGGKAEVRGMAPVLLVLAMAHQRLGHTEEARQSLTDALTRYDWNVNDMVWRGINHPLRRETVALLNFDEAEVRFIFGNALTRARRWPEAEAEYRQAVQLRPGCAEAHSRLGLALWEQDRAAEAQTAYREAIRLKPKELEAPGKPTFVTPWADSHDWVIKGQEVHQLDDAHVGRVFLFGDPNWTDYDFEAETQIIAGGSEVGLIFRATSTTRRLYAVVGAFGNTRHGVLVANEGGAGAIGLVEGKSEKGRWYRLRVEARENRFKMFLDGKLLMTVDADHSPRGSVGLLTNPVRARFRNIKVTDAGGNVLLAGAVIREVWDAKIAEYTRTIELQPKNSQAWHERAHTRERLQQWDRALADFSRAIELSPEQGAYWNCRARCYSYAGQADKALGDYTRAVELEPKNAGAQNNLAWLLATAADPELRDPARAVQCAGKAVELAPGQGHYWKTLGAAHYRAGDWKGALAALEKSMELRQESDNFDAFFLAMVHARLGDPEKGRHWYDEATRWMDKCQPDDEELRRFRAEAAELLKIKPDQAPATSRSRPATEPSGR